MQLHNLLFPHCWVCETRFSNQHPPGPAVEERHHLFPRCAGGTDGPIVSLCDTHHSKAHKIANHLKSRRDYSPLLVGLTKESQQRLMWIASLIVKAEALTAGDPNKQPKVMLLPTVDDRQKLAKLMTTLGVKNRAQVYEVAMRGLYKSIFGDQP